MTLLADESLAGRTRRFLREAGHTVLTVSELHRIGATNGEIVSLATTHGAILVTEDRGVGDLRTFPLGSHHGVIVLKTPGAEPLDAVHRNLREALRTITPEQLRGSLLIIDRNKFRLRRAPGDNR